MIKVGNLLIAKKKFNSITNDYQDIAIICDDIVLLISKRKHAKENWFIYKLLHSKHGIVTTYFPANRFVDFVDPVT